MDSTDTVSRQRANLPGLRQLLGLGCFAAALVALPLEATELKIGFVNTQRIFRDAPAAVKAAKKLETEFSRRDQDLQRLSKQLQTAQDSLEKNSLTMSENDRRVKEKEFSEMSREFQRKQREFREDLSLRQNEENAAVIDKANRIIQQIAEAEKYDLILQDVVWVNPKLDITEKVIRQLSDSK